MTQEDKTQDAIISFLKERLDKIDTKMEACATKRDLDRLINTDKEAREDLNIHCKRINAMQENVLLISETTKENKEFIKDIQGKVFYGFFVLLGLFGMIIYSAFNYFDKK